MKKTLTVLLIIVTLLSLFSCGNDEYNFSVKSGEKAYHELGLYYKLPKDFEQRNAYQEIEMYYSNGEACFFFNAFSATGIEETLGLDPDISVEDYTKKFIIFNGLDMDYDYDPETDRARFEYDYEYSNEDIEAEKYMYLIMRGTAHLYIITASCKLEYYSEYAEMFDELLTIVYAD
ncbi:MAG: hypothetical protein J6Q68_03770 [Clostridia bacterium]|nr:hypothetical protein [Clostridia bacterium]